MLDSPTQLSMPQQPGVPLEQFQRAVGQQSQHNTTSPGPAPVQYTAQAPQHKGSSAGVLATISSTLTAAPSNAVPVVSRAAPLASNLQPPRLPPAPSLPPSLTGPMPDAIMQPQEHLETLLHRWAALDKEGFFQNPVDERGAPNYYEIITQPMSFAVMREKLRNGCYMTWRSMRDDFELILSNARRYNQPKTLVYHAATALARSALKLTTVAELEARRALVKLFPETAHAVVGTAEGGYPGYALTITGGHDTPSEDLGGASAPSSPQRNGSVATAPLIPPHEAPSSPQHGSVLPDLALLTPPAPQPKHLCAFLSDEEDEDATDADVILHTQQPLDTVLQQLRVSALWQPWSAAAQGNCPAMNNAGRTAGIPTLDSSGRSNAWKQERRPTEWQCRWLERRMTALRAQQQLLETQLAATGRATEQAMQAAASPSSCANGRTATTTACNDELPQPHSAAGSVASELQVAAQRDLAAQASPFLSARHAAGVSGLPSLPPQNIPAPVHHLHGTHSSVSAEELAPAVAYGALELLSQQLLQLRAGLQDAFGADIQRSHDRRAASKASPASASAPAEAAATSTCNLGAAPGFRQQSQTLRRVSSSRGGGRGLTVITRLDSGFGNGKRKRSDGAELDGTAWAPFGLASVKACLDRGQSALILIPPVRELSSLDRSARQVALNGWAASFLQHGRSAFKEVPPEVAAALQAAGDGSSSEDTDDESYLERHKPLEAEEHKRYHVVATEGQRKRSHSNPGKGKTGMKTPRGGVRTEPEGLPAGSQSSPFDLPAQAQQQAHRSSETQGPTPLLPPPPPPPPPQQHPLVTPWLPVLPVAHQQQQAALPGASATVVPLPPPAPAQTPAVAAASAAAPSPLAASAPAPGAMAACASVAGAASVLAPGTAATPAQMPGAATPVPAVGTTAVSSPSPAASLTPQPAPSAAPSPPPLPILERSTTPQARSVTPQVPPTAGLPGPQPGGQQSSSAPVQPVQQAQHPRPSLSHALPPSMSQLTPPPSLPPTPVLTTQQQHQVAAAAAAAAGFPHLSPHFLQHLQQQQQRQQQQQHLPHQLLLQHHHLNAAAAHLPQGARSSPSMLQMQQLAAAAVAAAALPPYLPAAYGLRPPMPGAAGGPGAASSLSRPAFPQPHASAHVSLPAGMMDAMSAYTQAAAAKAAAVAAAAAASAAAAPDKGSGSGEEDVSDDEDEEGEEERDPDDETEEDAGSEDMSSEADDSDSVRRNRAQRRGGVRGGRRGATGPGNGSLRRGASRRDGGRSGAKPRGRGGGGRGRPTRGRPPKKGAGSRTGG